MTGPQKFKTCKSCNATKPVDDFYRRRNGYLSWLCKTCTIADNNRRKAEQRRLARAARASLPPAEEKVCTGCGESKRLDEYYRVNSSSERRISQCKECTLEKRREYYDRPGVREAKLASANTYAERNRDRIRTKNLKRYGITPESYDELFEAQGGACRICSRAGHRLGVGEVGATRHSVLCVDHDHDTGRVRGLLCANCNRAIGLLGDDPKILAAAIKYLKESGME